MHAIRWRTDRTTKIFNSIDYYYLQQKTHVCAAVGWYSFVVSVLGSTTPGEIIEKKLSTSEEKVRASNLNLFPGFSLKNTPIFVARGFVSISWYALWARKKVKYVANVPIIFYFCFVYFRLFCHVPPLWKFIVEFCLVSRIISLLFTRIVFFFFHPASQTKPYYTSFNQTVIRYLFILFHWEQTILICHPVKWFHQFNFKSQIRLFLSVIKSSNQPINWIELHFFLFFLNYNNSIRIICEANI